MIVRRYAEGPEKYRLFLVEGEQEYEVKNWLWADEETNQYMIWEWKSHPVLGDPEHVVKVYSMQWGSFELRTIE